MNKLSDIYGRRIYSQKSSFVGVAKDVLIEPEEGKIKFLLKAEATSILGRETTAAKKFIKENFTTLLEKLIERGEFKDFKSLLQEKLQAQTGHLPVYKLISQKGPDHARIFTIAVYNQSRLMAQARGRSKRKAEEGAARLALEKLSVGK